MTTSESLVLYVLFLFAAPYLSRFIPVSFAFDDNGGLVISMPSRC